jgi:hypothetical protein
MPFGHPFFFGQRRKNQALQGIQCFGVPGFGLLNDVSLG